MIHAPKGVEDILAPKSLYYAEIERKAADFFSSYGYLPIRTPTFEKTNLFLRSVGEETDVGKQMYTFNDKGGRSISLRPEGTAGIARSYIEHKIYGKTKDWRVYYLGPMFRYERPQAGRLREFYQIGAECFGKDIFWVDVEIVEMSYRFLRDLGLDDLEIQINSIGCQQCREGYVKELKLYLKENLGSLCTTCNRRFNSNPLRVLDCKNSDCKKVIEGAPEIENFLCSSCKKHFKAVREKLQKLDVPYRVNPYLVRGLDYYTRTIFEIISFSLGAQDAVCAGGRYDNLIEDLGGPPTPAIGFAIGVERLLLSLKKSRATAPAPSVSGVFVVTLGKEGMEKGMRIASLIRTQGIKTRVNFEEKGLSAQLKEANKEDFPWVLIVGENEIKKGQYILKNMGSGNQQYVNSEDFKVFADILKSGA